MQPVSYEILKHMKPAFLFILLGILLPWHSLAQEPFALATDHVSLRLSFDFPGETLEGQCTLKITNPSDETIDRIPLLLYRLMPVSAVTNEAGEAIGFSQQVVSFDGFPRWQVNHVLIEEPVGPHETKTISIDYGGYLLGYQETGMRYVTDRIDPAFTLLRLDAFAYPVVGIPDIAFLQRHMTGNLFSFEVEATVPDTLMVANGGILASVTHDGTGSSTYRYLSKQPAYRIDLAVAPYNKLEAGPLDIFYLGDSLAAARIAGHGQRAWEQYRSWWGDLSGSNRIAIIETERGSGGQADETCILLPEEGFSDDSDFQYLYHELSHLWHVKIREKQGISPRWEEGLATFTQVLADQCLNPGREGLLDRDVRNTLARFRRSLERSPLLRETPMIDYGNDGLTSYSYTQPMLMFSLLYDWLGAEVFHQAVGGFYQQYQATGASTCDFTDYWERLVPDEPLARFFNDWVYTTAYTELILGGLSPEEMIRHYNEGTTTD